MAVAGTEPWALLCVLCSPGPWGGGPASVPSALIPFPLSYQKAEIVKQAGNGLRIAQHVSPNHARERGGRESFCRNLLVFFRLRFAGGQFFRQQNLHALFQKSRSGGDIQ